MTYKGTNKARITLSLLVSMGWVCSMGLLSEAKCQRQLGELGKSIIEKRKKRRSTRFPIALINASDSHRSESADMAEKLLLDAGFKIASKEVVKNLEVEDALKRALKHPDTGAIIVIGGTGFASHDVSPEVVKAVIDKEIPGFAEIFRMITYLKFEDRVGEVGILALDTRALAGVYTGEAGKKIIVALPGSPEATELALTKLLIPDLPQLHGQIHQID